MNLEPREIRLPRRLVPSVQPTETAAILDEAFASVTDADFRNDETHDELSNKTEGTETSALAELLRDQLEALTRQQSNLKALLDSLSK